MPSTINPKRRLRWAEIRSQLIQSVDDWFRCAPPKGGADQRCDGRSAKEFARAWVESGVEDRLNLTQEGLRVSTIRPDVGD
jgi:hypothetical protein